MKVMEERWAPQIKAGYQNQVAPNKDKMFTREEVSSPFEELLYKIGAFPGPPATSDYW